MKTVDMEVARKPCRLCLTETEFNVSLFGSYCRKTNIVEKILVCLKVLIEDTDVLNTICFKCATNVENHYDFVSYIKKCQTKLSNDDYHRQRKIKIEESANQVNRRVTSYVREQVFDEDYTFSFLEVPEEKKEVHSSPFFSYFSPPNVLKKQSDCWKTPRSMREVRDERKPKKPCKSTDASQQCSRDIFESQSQDCFEDNKSLDWKLTPDDNILKRVREKCFGKSEF